MPTSCSASSTRTRACIHHHRRCCHRRHRHSAQIPKSLQSFTYSGVHWSGYIYPASQCENMRLYRRLLAPRCTTMYHAVPRYIIPVLRVQCVDHTTVRTGTGFESHSGTVLYIPVVLHHPRQSEAIRDHISDCLGSETVLKISTTRGVNSILPAHRVRFAGGVPAGAE